MVFVTVSLPSRERGLKHVSISIHNRPRVSLPSRERGLKRDFDDLSACLWSSLPSRERGLKQSINGKYEFDHVAPFTGAWIETSDCRRWRWCCKSLPSRERGLKLNWIGSLRM